MSVQILYPKPTQKPLYEGLVTQCKSLSLPFPTWDDVQQSGLKDKYDLIVDAMFGFSFKVSPPEKEYLHGRQCPNSACLSSRQVQGEPRPPFDSILAGSETACQPATNRQRGHPVRCMSLLQRHHKCGAGPA